MQLRERQVLFRDRCVAALSERGNTIGVAPTGAGKTVMGAAVVGALGGHSLILQHRDELVEQNRRQFELINPGISTGLFTAKRKETGYAATFAMVQTLARDANLAQLPPIDLLWIDEAHHSAATTYRRIIDEAAKRNPRLRLFGTTATPNRGDKKALRGVFDNCADQISLKELIDARHLVPPRTFVIDLGVRDALAGVRKTVADYDMGMVEKIMDKTPLNERIVEEWHRHAGDRQTVVFCSTVAHAHHVAATFTSAGFSAAVVDGELALPARQEILQAYDQRQIQILVNVAVLTEGWDHQPTSCIILLRPSSYKSTMIQMIGRGLRKVDPERYPGVHKDDCIVMDFGTSVLMHGGIEQDVNIDQEGVKTCPECQALCPVQCGECPICGFVFPPRGEAPTKNCGTCEFACFASVKICPSCNTPFPVDEAEEVGDFIMTELDLLDRSPFKWEELFDGLVLAATAFDAWAMVINYGTRWHCIGGSKDIGIRHLADNTDRLLSLATADDFLREHGDDEAASKSRRWLHEPATPKQLAILRMDNMTGFGLTKYKAACLVQWTWAERGIRAKLEATNRRAA